MRKFVLQKFVPVSQSSWSHLDQLAIAFRNDPRVLGFRVDGAKEAYEAQWNSEARSPLRWRSGEWVLWSGDEFEVVLRKAGSMREPIVKFYKDMDQYTTGAPFATATSALEADEFLRECAMELEAVIADPVGDLAFTFTALLPQICELWAKLKGYKADGVFERRYLVAGEPNPEAHMRCVNAAPLPAEPTPAEVR